MQSRKEYRNRQKRRYIDGLDGIRSIAVIAVIIYHLLPYSIKGGYLGVSMFFVVSGYLITDLLMQEWEKRGTIDLKNFYYRRLRRLYPALFAMVIGTGAYITLFQRSLIRNLGVTIWTNLLYVYNWWEINHGQSYFDRFQGESPFTHLWSLSIEAQYYFIWPLLLLGLLKVMKSRNKLFQLFLWSALIFAGWLTIVYHISNNINRVYYGTDTRMFSILFGAALAMIWPSTKLMKHIGLGYKWFLNLLGIGSFMGILYLLFNLAGQSAATYNWGMLAITVLTTLLVATCVHPAASINLLLTNPVFKWIGTRSYGIYLYQFPVMIFYEARVTSIGERPILNAMIEIAIILVISELSYRFIERPIRHFDFKTLNYNFIEFFKLHSRFGKRRFWIVPIVALVIICGYGSTNDHIQADSNDSGRLKSDIVKNQQIVNRKNEELLKRQKQTLKHHKPVKHRHLNSIDKAVLKDYELTRHQVLAAKEFPMTAIGDSIMADSAKDLQRVFPNAYISAQVGRQVWDAPDVINQLKANNNLAPNVLINLGTNSPMTDDQIEKVIKTIGPNHQIYWINSHVPTRYWEGQVNNVINKAAKRHANLHVIDWHRASENQNQLFWDDHVHPNPAGNNKYVSLIAKTIFNDQA
ncbi:acyltransferase family protein [Lactobacillaceae bacterium Scapto_B20]